MLGMAINIKSLPGQMCRWFGDMRNLALGSPFSSSSLTARGGRWNSHHSVSMYSCW